MDQEFACLRCDLRRHKIVAPSHRQKPIGDEPSTDIAAALRTRQALRAARDAYMYDLVLKEQRLLGEAAEDEGKDGDI